MPPTIHLVRHAQGLHNLSRENESILDPALTELGIQQCAQLKSSFPFHEKVVKFIASPLTRALDTCLLSFHTEGHKAVAVPELREVADHVPCDTGRDRDVLVEEFAERVDLARVTEGWNQPPAWTTWAAHVERLDRRASDMRGILEDIVADVSEDGHVVAVSHGAFLHFLTQDWADIKLEKGTGWTNTEYRSYQFTSSGVPALRETDESWERRNGSAPRASLHSQLAWREAFLELLENFITPSQHPVKG